VRDHHDRSTAINNDDVGTHYYGDGCADDHGRPDHIAAQFIDDCAPFLIDDRGTDLIDKLVDHGPSDYEYVDFDDHDEPEHDDDAARRRPVR